MSSGTAAEIVDFLNHFCDRREPPGYAVLIDAPWGAGKTFFVKAFLDARDKRLRAAEELQGPTYFYASLFGVKSIDQVREQFFAQAHPLLSSPLARALGSGFMGMFEKHTGFKMDKKVSVEKLAGEVKAGVVVFDDLERAALPLAEAFGLINNFVEHGDFRVIVIADQSKVPAATAGHTREEVSGSSYQEQREKVIGRVLTVSADPGAVLDSLTEKLTNAAAKGAVLANRDLVLLVFREGGRPNLRTLRSVLEDFDRLVSTVSASLSASQPGLRAVLAYMLAAGIEYRQGLTIQELVDMLTPRLLFLASGMKEDPAQTAARARRDKYSEVEWNDPVVPREALVNLFASGVIEREAINDHLAQHVLTSGPRPSPAWRRLWHWHSYGQAEYGQAKLDLRKDLTNHKITHPGILLHVIGLSIILSEFGDPLVAAQASYFRNYIKRLSETHALEPDIRIFEGVLSDTWGGLGYPRHDSPLFKSLSATLEKAVRVAFTARMKTAAPLLLEELRSNSAASAKLDDFTVEGNVAGKPILHEIDPVAFAPLLVDDGRIGRDLIGPLLRRYAHATTSCDLLKEGPWVAKLKAELLGIADALDAPFKKSLRQEVEHYFEAIEKSLADMKSYCKRGVTKPPVRPTVRRRRALDVASSEQETEIDSDGDA